MPFVFLLLFFAACENSSDSVQPTEVSKENIIRIYADTIGWDGKLPCEISYKGKKYKAAVKYRGGISSKYPKHSMTVEFEDQVKLGDLPMNDDYIFNASYVDKTFQRHKLSYDIFRLMDEKNKAPRCDYLPIYLNDKYIGLYVIMEKVNGSWLGFDKANPKGARLFKDPFIFVEERLPNVQEPDNYYQQKFPKLDVKDYTDDLDRYKKCLFEYDDRMFRYIATEGFWFDKENVVEWHLLLLLTNNDDGLIKNFYLYNDHYGGSLKFIPWDYDHSFGRDGNYDLNLIDRPVDCEKVVLIKRLMHTSNLGYRKKLKERYFDLRRTLFTVEALYEMIDANTESIQPHIKNNAKVWPTDSEWYSDANDYDQEIAIIKKYIPMRLKQLDAYFYNLEYGEEEKD